MKSCEYRLIIPDEFKDRYRESDYNVYVEMSGRYIVYNTFTEAVAELESCTIDKEAADGLLELGMLVEAETDELDMIRDEYDKREALMDSFHLIIALTMDCQLRCGYCYEEHPKQYMNPVVAAAVIDLVREKAGAGKNISIVWYGGEPLLHYSMLKNLTKAFQTICKENHVGYTASMISNGVALTDQMIAELDDLMIRSAQITVDGMAEFHDKRRPAAGGGKTFDRILRNIEKVQKTTDVCVKLRINVDKENIESAFELVRYCASKGLQDMDLTLGMLKEFGCDHKCAGCNPNLFSTEEFAGVFVSFRELAGELGFERAYEKMQPEYKVNSCTLDCPDSYVIDAEGYVYKCISQVGQPDKSIGNVITGFDETAHDRFSPFVRKECTKCKYFPICKGGCLNSGQVAGNQQCEVWRYATKDLIRMDFADPEDE